MDDAQTLILKKLDTIEEKFDGFNARVAILETKLAPLIDNGQPGIITKMGDRLTTLERIDWKERGFFSAMLVVIQIGYHFVLKALGQ